MHVYPSIKTRINVCVINDILSSKNQVKLQNEVKKSCYFIICQRDNRGKMRHDHTTLKTSRTHSYKTNFSMCIVEFRAFLGMCSRADKTTHQFLNKATKHLLHFSVPTQTS